MSSLSTCQYGSCTTLGTRCTRCLSIYYCGKEHQRADWLNHKKECHSLTLPYSFHSIQCTIHRVTGTDQLEMTADSDFKTGDILYCEPPFMIGTINDNKTTTEFKLVDLTRYMDVLFPRFTTGSVEDMLRHKITCNKFHVSTNKEDLFFLSSFIQHGCQPNTALKIEKGLIHVIAIRDITRGDRIEHDYDQGVMKPCLCSSCIHVSRTKEEEDERERLHNQDHNLGLAELKQHNEKVTHKISTDPSSYKSLSFSKSLVTQFNILVPAIKRCYLSTPPLPIPQPTIEDYSKCEQLLRRTFSIPIHPIYSPIVCSS